MSKASPPARQTRSATATAALGFVRASSLLAPPHTHRASTRRGVTGTTSSRTASTSTSVATKKRKLSEVEPETASRSRTPAPANGREEAASDGSRYEDSGDEAWQQEAGGESEGNEDEGEEGELESWEGEVMKTSKKGKGTAAVEGGKKGREWKAVSRKTVSPSLRKDALDDAVADVDRAHQSLVALREQQVGLARTEAAVLATIARLETEMGSELVESSQVQRETEQLCAEVEGILGARGEPRVVYKDELSRAFEEAQAVMTRTQQQHQADCAARVNPSVDVDELTAQLRRILVRPNVGEEGDEVKMDVDGEEGGATAQ